MSTSSANRRLLAATTVLSCLCIFAFIIAVWSFESNHKASCSARNTNADVFEAVIRKTLEPATGAPPLTAKQTRQIAAYEALVFPVIDSARC